MFSFLRSQLKTKSSPPDEEDLDSYGQLFQDLEFYAFNEPEPGSPPGTLVIDEDSAASNLFLIDYSPEGATGKPLHSPEECRPYLDSSSVSWVDVQGLGSEAVLQQLAQVFHLHPLLLEDVVNVPQRSKVEDYEQHVLMVLHMAFVPSDSEGFLSEQVSLIVGENYLLTVQEEPTKDLFEPVRQRIHRPGSLLRSHGTDYLAYALIDAVIDGFFPVLEDYGERLENLQEEVVEKPSRQTLDRIHQIKRELLLLRRTIWPQRDAISTLIREDTDLVSDSVRVYLRDCYDHAVQIMDMVENYRELAANLMDVYLTSVSNNTNEVMRFLTVISTTFIPLTFIAGVYGMNFDRSVGNMPELGWSFGYVLCLTGMGAVALGLLSYFWYRGWLFSPR
jgi:magnesium transporter